MMLQAASRGGAEILVTRDKALLELGMFENIEILSIENVMKKKG
jgi:predicted nucleic acid-binding protein